jgi:hypothetical protein
MSLRFACIVEGHGEIEAVPIVIRRIVQEHTPGVALQLGHTFRIPRGSLIKTRELERAVEIAGRRVGLSGGILIVLDSDDELPCILGPELLTRARKVRHDLPISVVLAKREFESWFLAAAESLRGRRGLAIDLEPPTDPESIRGAKEWLTARRIDGKAYVETLDQPALAAVFDLQAARKARSFDKFYRDVLGIVEESLQRVANPMG